jgi:phage gp16-like protein
LVVLRTPTLGVRGEKRSEAAMRAATAKTTVVKKPKAFWRRTTEEYMAGSRPELLRPCSSGESGIGTGLPVWREK